MKLDLQLGLVSRLGVGMRAIKMFVAALAIVIRPDKPTRVSPTRNITWE